MQGQFLHEGCAVDFTPVAACYNGDVVQLPGGLAGICSDNIDAGALGSAIVHGVVKLPKKANIALLKGGDVFWDVSASVANYIADSGTTDFYVGTAESDAAAADSYVNVRLNHVQRYAIDLARGGQEWTEALTGSGPPTLAVRSGGVLKANIINTNEAQAVTVMSARGVLPTSKPIFEGRWTRVAGSNNTLDFDLGLATGVSTSDFEAVTAFVVAHLDGGDNDIDTQSDDGTTDRAPADTSINDTDGTPFEVWIDCRDDTNCLVYINGVLVDTSGAKLILTAAIASALYAVFSIEKTSGTATGEAQVSRMRVRTMAE